jgi:hypothetical protein
MATPQQNLEVAATGRKYFVMLAAPCSQQAFDRMARPGSGWVTGGAYAWYTIRGCVDGGFRIFRDGDVGLARRGDTTVTVTLDAHGCIVAGDRLTEPGRAQEAAAACLREFDGMAPVSVDGGVDTSYLGSLGCQLNLDMLAALGYQRVGPDDVRPLYVRKVADDGIVVEFDAGGQFRVAGVASADIARGVVAGCHGALKRARLEPGWEATVTALAARVGELEGAVRDIKAELAGRRAMDELARHSGIGGANG